ncbi:polysaccharide deacetylase family protein [Dermatophilaceae bacterium Sec6.4]
MDISRRGLLVGSGLGVLGAVGGLTMGVEPSASAATVRAPFRLQSRAATVAKFAGQRPSYWGFYAPGVHSTFSTATAAGKDAIALAFDACGGTVTYYDAALIATLRKYQAPATLFINRVWATNNQATFKELLADPLFEIESHGWAHIPLSVTGRSAYGIRGTSNVAGVWEEVAADYWWMGYNCNHATRFMRVGTCFTDDVSARAATWMGQELVSFAVNGDAGATFPADVVYSQVMTSQPGDILISHMNRPGSGTNPGYQRAIPALKAKGFAFRHLNQVVGATTVTTQPAGWATISQGSHGSEVAQVQRVVHVTADGYFGPLTKAAVVRYQSAHHLTPDGIVGPLTATAMGLTT